ncbi:hypothetical protein DBV14_19320 [Variovorax sp. KBW07]|uniref:DUF3304 domain-containing protein n=1 Tax=Variovorax sp. KBW07 TaxID=2153358 RepID=UPI000F568468|nr:DUF3304 domain-containing protein [Variovorax sp. KBW07]RQO48811.1 hypothetical protein DBV14_19320 [Variovorax sp. KBW07]
MKTITAGNASNRSRLASRLWRSVGVSYLVLMLIACDNNEMLAGDVTGYNHMPDSGWSIAGFTINGAGGSNAQPGSGAGNSCCMSFPKHWQPGMKAKIRWVYDVKVGDPRTPPPPQEAEVDIPEYTTKTAGAVQVHFYSDHRVKVVISIYGLGHPRYPMTAEDKLPWVTRNDIVDE